MEGGVVGCIYLIIVGLRRVPSLRRLLGGVLDESLLAFLSFPIPSFPPPVSEKI